MTTTNPNETQTLHRDFADFHDHVTGKATLADIAARRGISTRTLQRRFHTLWLIPVPNSTDPNRVYDQVFIDGTYTKAGCLLVASTSDHVIAWHWCTSESIQSYSQLLKKIAPPLCVVRDGGQGADTAIKRLWPTTRTQRCLVHIQRGVRRYTTSRPRTKPGQVIYALALKLTKIRTLDQARDWTAQLHNFADVYKDFLNEKTYIPHELRRTKKRQWEYTHKGVRSAYNLLLNVAKKDHLFAYLTPPKEALDPTQWKATTNPLEGGINSPLKLLARQHRGRGGERQRTMIDWWLHSKTQPPDDPHTIARQCNYGKDQLAKVPGLSTKDYNTADHQTGRPALYDNAIPTEYNHSIGIRKGWAGT